MSLLAKQQGPTAVFAGYRDCRKHIKRERANKENGVCLNVATTTSIID